MSTSDEKLPLATASLSDLSFLQRRLINLCGGTRAPLVRTATGELDSGFFSMRHQILPPPDDRQDPLSSPIDWAASFIPANTRTERMEKGWPGHVTTGLAVITDALHQQFINFGRSAKNLIDMKEVDPSVRAAIAQIPIPGSSKATPVPDESTMLALKTAMNECPTVPIRLRLREGSAETTTFHFTNVKGMRLPRENDPKNNEYKEHSLFGSLMALHTLSNGNVSRISAGVDRRPDKMLLTASGPAEDAIRTMDNIKLEFARQLTQMQHDGDKRLKDVNIEQVVNSNFDINRDVFAKQLKQQAGFIQVAGLISHLTHDAYSAKTTIGMLLDFLGEKQRYIPVLENADQAKRLVMAIAHRTKMFFNPMMDDSKEWKAKIRQQGIDIEKLKKELDATVEAHPDDIKAVLKLPETKKLISFADGLAQKHNDRNMQRAIDTLGIMRQEKIQNLDSTLRGPRGLSVLREAIENRHDIKVSDFKGVLAPLGIDFRRRSTIVDALKQGYSDKTIGEASEAAAERLQNGEEKKSFSKLLREEIKKRPREL